MRLFLLPLLLLAAAPALADSLRCGSRLISSGDTSSDVLERCGQPVDRSYLGNRIVVGDWGQREEVRVEEWIYGPWNGMLYFVRLRGNRVDAIQSKRSN
ncbi:Protein of unknown function [Pseudomonas citronellolis]|uniref:DUF2845 domain-containing protein n=1 Tax=Pseudomonas citronellolis TaxID=53408 RepID=A0AAQ1HPX4_9PSED|nr:DUF2845 domain-containing protein [Pseudomonas citronellolis]MDN6874534.1 DUF2845 domain-containing protein [Pseudomonas citronellolis]TGC25443.1 DUF2845 domain-containing protein [Pseudomonas citronellolis]UXJ53609.1 DUF2845 domain-containing protein [Pseudomonas citronellolis]SFD13249.1 Protein of unknown function [Pseudomonas citronellolis]GBL60279.1 hypothetical protein PCLA_17f0055 [Pseudomonas citronellolis]